MCKTGLLEDIEMWMTVTGLLADTEMWMTVTRLLADTEMGMVITGLLADVEMGLAVTGLLVDIEMGLAITGLLANMEMGMTVPMDIHGELRRVPTQKSCCRHVHVVVMTLQLRRFDADLSRQLSPAGLNGDFEKEAQ